MVKKRHIVIGVIAVTTLLFVGSSCTTSTNNLPIIAGFQPSAEQVVPLGTIQVACNASDPDGDELSYIWSASGGEISGGGAIATWTAAASEGSYSVTVKVIDGLGGEAFDSVAITVRTNAAPAIVSLTADADWTTPSGNLQVTCSASDPDSDELSYEWSANGGDISGAGSSVAWSAPAEIDVYVVTVVVADGYGGSTTGSLSISVATGQPPDIETLLVTAEHCYLQPQSWGYRVGKEQEYDVDCVVSDPAEGLSYQWSCTDGGISETSQDGSAITWIAPDESMYVTITVVVSDVVGNMVGENVLLEVVACSPCTFGC